MVQKLEEKGWGARQADAIDERVSLVSITDAGTAALNAYYRVMDYFLTPHSSTTGWTEQIHHYYYYYLANRST